MPRIKKNRTSADFIRLAINKLLKAQAHVLESVNKMESANLEDLALSMSMMKKLEKTLHECTAKTHEQLEYLKLSLVEQVNTEDKKELEPVS